MKNQKINYLMITVIILVCVLVLSLGRNYLRKQNKTFLSPTTVINITKQQSSTNTLNWIVYTNKTFEYSIQFPATYEVPPQTDKEKNQKGVDNNISVKRKLDPSSGSVVIIDVSMNSENMSLEDYMNKNSKMYGITGPIISYNFNGYDSLFNRNQPGTNVFVKQGRYIYHIIASTASQDTEIENIIATFKFTQ